MAESKTTHLCRNVWQAIALAAAVALFASTAHADETYSRNHRANQLYKQGKYDEALKLYEDALLLSPGNQKLAINKGSAQYQQGDFDKAEESYKSALSAEDKKVLADLHYNLGNALFREGEKMQTVKNPQAAEKYKEAYEHYIKTLDLRPKDGDAKWNLQLAYQRMKQQQQQNQQNQQNKQNQNDKNQQQKQNQNQNQQQNKDQQKKEDQQAKNDQQQKDKQQQDQQKQNQQQQDQQKQDQQQQQTQAQNQNQNPDKKDAARLIQQYSDDADQLNKPQHKVRAMSRTPQKDW
jgi:Ca-activated chloride channel homolog